MSKDEAIEMRFQQSVTGSYKTALVTSSPTHRLDLLGERWHNGRLTSLRAMSNMLHNLGARSFSGKMNASDLFQTKQGKK